MRIYFLAQRVPFPPDRGDKITTFHEVRHLAANHEVEVFCLAGDHRDMRNADALCKSVSVIVHAVPLRRFAARIRALLALPRRIPATVAYFDEGRLHRIIRRRMAEAPADVIFVYSSGMAQFVESFTKTPRIMQFAELDSRKWKQYSKASAIWKRWIYSLESVKLFAYEQYIAKRFSQNLVCTDREKQEFEILIPGAKIDCMPNGVDLEFFSPRNILRREGSVIFTGVMDYYPNVDAVTWFCKNIYPEIRIKFPDFRFTICGSHPTRRVRKLAQLPGVVVTGRVADVRPYLGAAVLAVVPLRMGRGIQNKVLEAMAMGLPCVVTSTARTGIPAENDKHLFVADQAQVFAAKVIELLEDAALRARMGTEARAFVTTHYGWDVALRKMDSIIASAAQWKRADNIKSTDAQF